MTYSIATPVTSTTDEVSPDLLNSLLETSTEASFRYAGLGSFLSTWQTVLSGIDRFGTNPTPPNHEVAGLIFITRPKLNLSTSSLKQDRILSTLNTFDPYSFPFSIRSYLDSKLARSTDPTISASEMMSPFVNSDVPFIVPITNCHESSGGWPDFFVDTETSQGGFFGEDQTIARGSDFNTRSYDFSITVRDFQGGYLMALFYYWVYYIAAQCRGLVTAYPEDIYAQRLNYTCSIYRFVLDPSRQFITKWAKATGCFPKNVPLGDAFNVPSRENYIHSTQQFTIPFQVNHVSYMDPIIFQEFNAVVERWAGSSMSDSLTGPDINANRSATRVRAPINAFSNFRGIPWIDRQSGFNQLDFWALPEELTDPSETVFRQLMESTGNAPAESASTDATSAVYSSATPSSTTF